MRHILRGIEAQVARALKGFPALVLTGPRRAGKTWLLQHLFPEANCFLLEDPDIVARFRADPQGFLDAVKTPAILDELFLRFVNAYLTRRSRLTVFQGRLNGSLSAALPSTRVSTTMHYCNNDYFCILDSVIDTEREAVNHCTSGASMNGRIHDGCLGDRREDSYNLIEELLSEPRSLSFVP